MKKNKRLFIGATIVATIIILILGAIWGLRIRIEDGQVRVGNSLLTPYAYRLYQDYVVLEKYSGQKETVVIPETILGKPVIEIDFKCFADNEIIKSVVLSKNIETIGIKAFVRCKNLMEVTGGANVRKIDDCAFEACEKLECVSMGTLLEGIGMGAFAKCKTLKNMEPQNNLIYIGDMAFIESGLEDFEFNRDAEIGNRVFDGTKWIANQPEEFIICGDGNLIGYTGNDEVVKIPEGVKTLNGGCFAGTTAREIYLPKTVTAMQGLVFSDCTACVYVPDSVVQMGDEEQRYSIMNNDAFIRIVTTRGSYAHQYAMENDIDYRIVKGW